MEKTEEYKYTLERVKTSFKLREGTLIIFISFLLLAKIIGIISYLKQLDLIIMALFFWLFSAFLFRFFVNREVEILKINNFYFLYDILIEVPIMAFIVYFAGGVEWIGLVFFFFPISYVGIVLSRKSTLFVCLMSSICYIFVAILPYFDLVPFFPYFDLGFSLYKEKSYMINNIIFATFTFFLIGIAISIFSELLKKKTIDLNNTKDDLEKERLILKERVDKRTTELKEVNNNLEKTIKERTEKLREKMEELEKFNKATVDRELKMVELKKEIESLRKKLF